MNANLKIDNGGFSKGWKKQTETFQGLEEMKQEVPRVGTYSRSFAVKNLRN